MSAEPRSQSKEHIVILGAGVIGLQTALTLLQSGLYTTTTLAAHLPGHTHLEYTSPWAGGHWRTHASSSSVDAEQRAWDAQSYAYWTSLLSRGESIFNVEEGRTATDKQSPATMKRIEEHIGLGFRTSLQFWSQHTNETISDGANIWWRDTVADFTILPKDALPVGACFGISYTTICINVPRYLSYLEEQIVALGGDVVQCKVGVEDGLAGVVKEVLTVMRKKGKTTDSIVNAAGLSALHFVGNEEAARLFPVRGQTVLVKGEADMAHTFVGYGVADAHAALGTTTSDIAYCIPRPGSGTTILGGSKVVGDWSGNEDKPLTAVILERCKILAKELLTDGPEAGVGEFDVLSVQVGHRPGRRGGPRVEVEIVDGVKVVHAYGHAGAGYQNSIGTAAKVMNLVERQTHGWSGDI